MKVFWWEIEGAKLTKFRILICYNNFEFWFANKFVSIKMQNFVVTFLNPTATPKLSLSVRKQNVHFPETSLLWFIENVEGESPRTFPFRNHLREKSFSSIKLTYSINIDGVSRCPLYPCCTINRRDEKNERRWIIMTWWQVFIVSNRLRALFNASF